MCFLQKRLEEVEDRLNSENSNSDFEVKLKDLTEHLSNIKKDSDLITITSVESDHLDTQLDRFLVIRLEPHSQK